MNAPLSRFLTQFSAVSLAPAKVPAAFEERITLAVSDLEARLEAAATAARAEAEADAAAQIVTLSAAHDTALAEAVAAARAEWVENESNTIAAKLSEGMSALQTMLADRLAAVLRPLVSDVLVTRAKQELGEALDRLLADGTKPTLAVKGAADLIASLRADRPAPGIRWMAAATQDVTIIADPTRIETCLGAALTSMAATET